MNRVSIISRPVVHSIGINNAVRENGRVVCKPNLKSVVKMTEEKTREDAVFGVRDAPTQFLVARVRDRCTSSQQYAPALGSCPATPPPMQNTALDHREQRCRGYRS